MQQQQATTEQLMDVLEEMADMRAKEGEQFKSRAFKKAHDTLAASGEHGVVWDTAASTTAKLKKMAGFGPSVMAICAEFIATGKVQVLEDFRKNPVNVFADIYGVGPKMAQKFIAAGYCTLADLRNAPAGTLNDKQVIGLRYYDDIKARIPREVIVEYEAAFRAALPKIAGVEMEIVGSYRRGAVTSGDIDVIFTYRPPCASAGLQGHGGLAGLFTTFIKNMVKTGLIQKEHILANGESKCLVLARLAGAGDTHYRRIDFLCTPPQSYAAAILYFTGSKYFNTVMRQWAVDHGYTMNEHGIYRLEAGHKKGEMVSAQFVTEADIFAFLGLVYKTPVERRDGRDVVACCAV